MGGRKSAGMFMSAGSNTQSLADGHGRSTTAVTSCTGTIAELVERDAVWRELPALRRDCAQGQGVRKREPPAVNATLSVEEKDFLAHCRLD
jgi:hypothetical protein